MEKDVGAPVAKKTRPKTVPGQLIVRFKPAAVASVAAIQLHVATRRGRRGAALPDEIGGPLEALRADGAIKSISPLFVASEAGYRQPTVAGILPAARRSLSLSATETRRDGTRR